MGFPALFEASADTLLTATGLPDYRHESLTAAAAFFARHREVDRAAIVSRALSGG